MVHNEFMIFALLFNYVYFILMLVIDNKFKFMYNNVIYFLFYFALFSNKYFNEVFF